MLYNAGVNGRNDKRAAINATATRRVVIVVFEGANALDVAGPSTVFSTANQVHPGAYTIRHASLSDAEVASDGGLRFAGLTPLATLRGPIDTLVLVGGDEAALRKLATDQCVLALLRRFAGRADRVASVCTGAFLLAAAGMLDGRRAVTHWASCELLGDLFPRVMVEQDAIYVRDGKYATSAGVSAGIDLSLGLIEEDLGRQVAGAVAKSLVVYLRRPGGQSQFSAALRAQSRGNGPFSELVSWLTENLQSDLSVARIASQCGMSERTFHRRFAQWAGESPASFVRNLRVEAARNWLESTDWPIKRVAQRSGFGSVDSLERAFARQFGVTPGEIRQRFGAAKPQ